MKATATLPPCRHMLARAEIARREEFRCAKGVSEVAREARPFLDGIASRDTPGTWASMAVAAGLDHATIESLGAERISAEIAELAAWYESAGIEPRVDCAPFVHRSFLRALSAQRFVVRHYEQVFFRPLAAGAPLTPHVPTPPSLEIRIVDGDDDAMITALVEAICTGFCPLGTPPSDAEISLCRRCALHARTLPFAALLDGRCVGGGFLEQLDDLVALFALSVLPEHRRRGVQQALMAARLNHAVRVGATLATISGTPGQGTERNVRRFGFDVAYTRISLIRPGPGLVGERG